MKRHRQTLLLVLALGFSLSAQAKSRPDEAMIAARSKVFGPENVNQKNGEVDSKRVICFLAVKRKFARLPQMAT